MEKIAIYDFDDYIKYIFDNLYVIKAQILKVTRIDYDTYILVTLDRNEDQIIEYQVCNLRKSFLNWYNKDDEEYQYVNEMLELIDVLKRELAFRSLPTHKLYKLIEYETGQSTITTGYLLKSITLIDSNVYRKSANNAKGVAYWVLIRIYFNFDASQLHRIVKRDFIEAMVSKVKSTNETIKKYKISFKNSIFYRDSDKNALYLDFQLTESEYWRLEKLEIFDKSKKVRAMDRAKSLYYKGGCHIAKLPFTRNSDYTYRKWRIAYDYYGYLGIDHYE